MSRTNETRFIKWRETCKCIYRLDGIFCNSKQRWNENKCTCECKELIDKGVCDKGFLWKPSNCECDCHEICDIGKYSDYEECKCRKKLADKLIDECAETIDETKLANITFTENENNYECGSCMVYIVLMMVIVISTGITIYLVYYNCSLIKNNTHKKTLTWWVQLYKMGTVKQIKIKNRTYYFYNDIIDLENFDAKLLKTDKNHIRTLVFTILDMSQRKK